MSSGAVFREKIRWRRKLVFLESLNEFTNERAEGPDFLKKNQFMLASISFSECRLWNKWSLLLACILGTYCACPTCMVFNIIFALWCSPCFLLDLKIGGLCPRCPSCSSLCGFFLPYTKNLRIFFMSTPNNNVGILCKVNPPFFLSFVGFSMVSFLYLSYPEICGFCVWCPSWFFPFSGD